MFQIATFPRLDLNAELLVIFIDQKFTKLRNKSFIPFPKAAQTTLEDYFLLRDFKGELNQTALLYPSNKDTIKRILLVGLGEEEKITDDDIRNLGKTVSLKQRELSVNRVHILLGNLSNSRENLIRFLSEGVLYERYRFEQHKTENKKKHPSKNQRFIFLCSKAEYTPKFRQILMDVQAAMQGVVLARDLANQPANHLSPLKFKNRILDHFKSSKNITVTVLSQKQLEDQKLNALLAVAKGSSEAPYLIIIHYKPLKKKVAKKLALVGKGVTFDSGGISIKPSQDMEEMKYDMAGAAAVVGSMETISVLSPKFEVIGIIPAVENMPGGEAVKPSDVVTALNGKTIEIINTDAEGRLILADALTYAENEYSPNAIIDFATLTGACYVALGDKRAGLFTKAQNLSDLLVECGDDSGDKVWPMPMDDSYNKDLESKVADIKNLGSRWGGAITAAKFLEHFVKKSPWVHIDMAGTSNDITNLEYLGKGATGFGVRLIAQALKKLEKTL